MIKQLQTMYLSHQYEELILLYKKTPKNDYIKLFAGLSYIHIGLGHEAVFCLSNVDPQLAEELSIDIYRFLGISYYFIGNYEESCMSFSNGIKWKEKESYLWRALLFPDLFDKYETTNIIFRFVQEVTPLQKKLFIYKNLKAFSRIVSFTQYKELPKKIDIYCYTSRFDSIGNRLSYADNGIKCIHTYLDDVEGHELAHIIFNSIHPLMKRNRFIDEGIASFFNTETSYKELLARGKQNRRCKYDIISLWKNRNLDFSGCIDLLNFAGAFVGFLIYTYGATSFIEFIQDESFEHAERHFFPPIHQTINQFIQEAYHN